ncbi:PEGA domain-containing protein [Candidatus Parcubacteria bacterium]|nr:PEGA domain-containing protein [Candidatus Parcubacteria bacterium]
MKRGAIATLGTLASLVIITWGIILFAKGYRIDFLRKEVRRTGMISVRSYPDGAKVYLNGELVAVTDDSIASLKPGRYHLEIRKEGFTVREKEVPVFEELVTDIEALLISRTPRLEPLTQTGARSPALSSSRDKIAFFSPGGEKSGLKMLTLSWDAPLNLFRATSPLLLQDTPSTVFSIGEKILWAPDDSSLLIQMNERGFYELPLNQSRNGREPLATSSAEPALSQWGEKIEDQRILFLEKKQIRPDLAQTAIAPPTLWSPDEQKFLFKKETEGKIEYRVYSLEDPLPVGAERETTALRVDPDSDIKVSWFSSNNHLILVEGSGTVSLIEIDGGNRTEVFTGTLASRNVFPTPAGDKLIILTTFNPNEEPNLYAVGLR